MAPLRGWAPRGHRLPTKVPHGRWKTMTFLAALRSDRIDAPWFIEGPIDGESFRTYVAEVLLPTLRPGDIVIMDNLGSHKSKAVRQIIRSVGAKLFFLPKYSPDLNPIEQVFAKLKHLLRKAAARTVDAVCAAIGELLTPLHPKNAPITSKLRLSKLISSCFKDIEITSMRVAVQILLDQPREARESTSHVGMAGRKPNPNIAGDRNHRRSSTSRTRASASGSTCASTRIRRRLPRSISISPFRAVDNDRIRLSSSDCGFALSSPVTAAAI